jgi:hypothetical protein
MPERYTKLRNGREYGLEWAERIGLGFDVPPSIGQLGQPRIVPKGFDGRREGIRTPNLLVANNVNSKLRRGAAIT